MLRVVVLVVVFGVLCEVRIMADGKAVMLVHSLFPFFAFEREFKVECGIERGCFEDLASTESAEGRWFGVGIPEEICVNFPIYSTVIDVTFAT